MRIEEEAPNPASGRERRAYGKGQDAMHRSTPPESHRDTSCSQARPVAFRLRVLWWNNILHQVGDLSAIPNATFSLTPHIQPIATPVLLPLIALSEGFTVKG